MGCGEDRVACRCAVQVVCRVCVCVTVCPSHLPSATAMQLNISQLILKVCLAGGCGIVGPQATTI